MERDSEQISEIKREFQDLYHLARPYCDFVSCSALTNRLIIEWLEREQQDPLEKVRADLLGSGQDPDELFIEMYLTKEPHEKLSIPSEYKGVKVHITPMIGARFVLY